MTKTLYGIVLPDMSYYEVLAGSTTEALRKAEKMHNANKRTA